MINTLLAPFLEYWSIVFFLEGDKKYTTPLRPFKYCVVLTGAPCALFEDEDRYSCNKHRQMEGLEQVAD